MYPEIPEDLMTLDWSSHLARIDRQKMGAAHVRWGPSSLAPAVSTSLSFCTRLGAMAIRVWNLEIVNLFTLETASCVQAVHVLSRAKMF